jgi:hypothetical protein
MAKKFNKYGAGEKNLVKKSIRKNILTQSDFSFTTEDYIKAGYALTLIQTDFGSLLTWVKVDNVNKKINNLRTIDETSLQLFFKGLPKTQETLFGGDLAPLLMAFCGREFVEGKAFNIVYKECNGGVMFEMADDPKEFYDKVLDYSKDRSYQML